MHFTSVIRAALRALLVMLSAAWASQSALAEDTFPRSWKMEWPDTDFSRHGVSFDEIFSGGSPKDGIPAIDAPEFESVSSIRDSAELVPGEPVIGVIIGGQAKAYPLRILMWHEIANDTLGGIPLTVTYCPLCNSAIVFDRRIAGMTLDFGTTGKLRNSDLVMYDRQTQSWWQQFLGTAIVGEMTGRSLNVVPSRLESFAVFAERAPDGLVMVAKDPSRRSYGENPYVGYDSRAVPYQFFQGDFPENIAPMARVVAVGKQAWSMALLREKGEIRSAGLIIRWRMGQNSALDAAAIAKGRDVGNVVVSRIENGAEIDVAHDITFAFVFHAFHPDGTIVIP